jgi:hypothetical protein
LPPAIEVQLKQRSIPDAIAIVASQETKEQTHTLKSRKNGRKKEENKNTFFQTFSSKTAKKRKRNPHSFKLSLSLSLSRQKTTRKRKRKPLSFKLPLQRMKERKKQKTKKQFLSNSLFKESKKKKRVTLSFKLSLQRVQVKEEEKQTSFQSHFTHLFLLLSFFLLIFLRRVRKTKITLCFDGYLILLITPGSSLFTLSEEENRRVWDVSLGEV